MDFLRRHPRRVERKATVPKPLNIRKSRPSSRYLASSLSITGQQPSTALKNSDADRFTKDDDHMSDLLEKINEVGNLYHLELDHRLKTSHFDPSDHYIQLSNHLASFNWKTPPVSPTLLSDGSIVGPESPGIRQKKRELQKNLREKALKSLIASDKKYHNLERNLTGLKEWWAENRVAWQKQRDVIQNIKSNMEALHIQRQNADGDVARAQKDFSYEREFNHLKARLSWFDDRERLMYAVKQQCKRIQGDVVSEEKIIQGQSIQSEWSKPQEFSFAISEDVKADVTKALWWSKPGRGFPWWLQTACSFLEWNLKSSKALQRDYIDEKTKYDLRLEALARQSQNFGRGVKEEHEPQIRDQTVVAQQRHLQFSFVVLDITRRIDTHDVYLRLLKRLLFTKGNWYTTARLRNFVNNVHLIFYLLIQEMNIHKRFLYAADNDALSLDESIKALKLMEDHFVYNEQYYRKHDIIGDNILSDIAKSTGPKEDGLMATVAVLELINDDYEAVVQEIEELVAHNEEYKRRQVELQDIRPESPTLPPEVSLKDNAWGNMTRPIAYNLLRQDHLKDLNGNRQPTWNLLRQFFVSPDVAPSFYDIRGLSGNEFVQLANSFLKKPLDAEIWEAFVFWCQYEADELFNKARNGKVYAEKVKGWELVNEMSIRGPPRRVLLQKPSYFHDLSHWMVHNQKRFSFDGPNRQISEKAIYAILKQYYPNRLTLEDLWEHLSYFSQAGLFYKYAPKSAPSGDPILIRIDNGWHFKPMQPYTPLFDGTFPVPTYFSEIRKAYTSLKGQDRVDAAYRINPIMTDFSLYEILRPELTKIQPMIGEQRFHMWLRWCDQNNDLFHIHRNGQLDFIEPNLI